MKKNICFLFLAVFIALSGVFSTPLEDLIIPVNVLRLRSGGEFIMEMQPANPSLRLMPANNELRRYISGVIEMLTPNMMVETLSLYKKPEHSRTDPLSWDETQKIGITNQLMALSTLAGIQYYSASRKSMRTFFEYSRVIDDPSTKNPLPDPVFSVLPEQLTLYARQKDLTFGDNVYRYDYLVNSDVVFFVQENITPLTVAFLQAVGKGKLKTVIAVFDCGDVLLVYVSSMAKTASIPGMGERIGNSFSSRAEAVLKWFSGRADLVFQ
ncbi:MAG: hypothetical protein LBC76_02230 [Treponema sp.]|jgi:hypothetical protein|nr:hypothetical protein [Treponema sp.]